MTKPAKRNAVSETDAWIKHEIQKLAMAWKKGEADWRVIADHLLRWEEALSVSNPLELRQGFSEGSDAQIKPPVPGLGKYVRRLAEEMKVQVSNLWRYRKAALAARIIWGDRSVDSPFDIPDHASPESIELVEKIFRAAPLYVAADVAERLYKNDITRTELRRIWQDIRHVVDGPAKPFTDRYKRMSEEDSIRVAALFENLCFEALRNSFQHEEYESVLGGIGGCFRGIDVAGSSVDIVALSQDKEGNTYFHAIEVVQSLGPKARAHLEHLRSVFDMVWVAIPDEMLATFGNIERYLPRAVGILVYEKQTGTLKVRKRAERNPDPDLYVIRSLAFQVLNLTH